MVPDYTSQPVLTLFMWETGSFFDSICNEIQNDPSTITPAVGPLMELMGNATGPALAMNVVNATGIGRGARQVLQRLSARVEGDISAALAALRERKGTS